jgi:F-type H+-transporting ATPase subunit epsilon
MADLFTSKTFQFDLVSPEKVLASEEASMVVVPGEAGDFGVLAEHAPLLSSIRPGVVTITSPNGDVRKIFVTGGFADVSPKLCSILAEQAINVSDIDRSAVEQQLKSLREELPTAHDDVARANIQHAIAVAEAKLAA